MSLPSDRCPRCAATVSGAAAWCTLCYADLRQAAPTTTSANAAPASPAAETLLAVPAPVAVGPTAPAPALRGRHAARPAVAASEGETADIEPSQIKFLGVKDADIEGSELVKEQSLSDGNAAPSLTDAEIDAMIERLAVQSAAEPQPLGGLLQRFATPGSRVALMAVGATALALLIFGLLSLVGALTG